MQTSVAEVIFAQLLYMFMYTHNSRDFYMALVHPMDNPVPLSDRGRDRALRFTRVVARARSTCVVVELATIVQGTLLVKNYDAQIPNSEYIVLDVIDADMWWRMKSISLAHKVAFTYQRTQRS